MTSTSFGPLIIATVITVMRLIFCRRLPGETLEVAGASSPQTIYRTLERNARIRPTADWRSSSGAAGGRGARGRGASSRLVDEAHIRWNACRQCKHADSLKASMY